VVASPTEAADAVSRLSRIDRAAVRHDCEQRFSCDAVVDTYARLYAEAVA
jgi:hypothetical protein